MASSDSVIYGFAPEIYADWVGNLHWQHSQLVSTIFDQSNITAIKKM